MHLRPLHRPRPSEVQQIVRIANRYRVPLYAISTGKNLGYGGSAPAYSGCVVLDLKRMNRIIEVNEANAFALVEPGVSYFDLYRYIQDRKLKVWIDCPDPGWGSVVGNAIDRGGGYTAANYRNHFDSHCGMEVVLPSGELLRTGMGAIPKAETWQQYKSGCGPWIDGIFSQSNYGIVTKMGFWLMPQPEAYMRVHGVAAEVPRFGADGRDAQLSGELAHHGWISGHRVASHRLSANRSDPALERERTAAHDRRASQATHRG